MGKDPEGVVRRWRDKLRWRIKSRKLWEARSRRRARKVARWERRESAAFQRWYRARTDLPDGHPDRSKTWRAYQRTRGHVEKWERLLDEAEDTLGLRREQVRTARKVIRRWEAKTGDRPDIIELDLAVRPLWGALGVEHYVTGHHTAGPTDRNLNDAIRLCRSYHEAHAAKGWGGIGYHYCIARTGELLLLRPVTMKGAHVGGHNTGNPGVMCHGTTGDRPTAEQAATLRWLLANAHTDVMPRSHRTGRDLRDARLRGHNDWPGHATNACPGTHKRMYVSGGRER